MTLDSGDTAWILTSSMLVFMMTFGLSFFYGSLVGEAHIQSVMTRTLCSMGLITIQWVLFGYSFAFGIDASSFWGNWMWGGLIDLGDFLAPSPQRFQRSYYAANIPGMAFCIFQLSFAVITPSIITGALVGRMSFGTWLVFIFLWTTLVYDPIAHWVWSDKGWLHELGALDFAGGSVVHISSGFAALAGALVMGKRKFPESFDVDIDLNVLGGGMLWLGWFGFNGGSALASGQIASLAFLNSQISAGSTMFFWMIIELTLNKSVTLEGAIYAGICGLVVITPACGYVLPGFCIIIGLYTAILSYGFLYLWRKYAHHFIDDPLYVFCSHGIGGVLGSITTGLFATKKVNPDGADGAFYGNPILLGYQLADICATASWSFVVTAIIVFFVKHMETLLRPYLVGDEGEEKAEEDREEQSERHSGPHSGEFRGPRTVRADSNFLVGSQARPIIPDGLENRRESRRESRRLSKSELPTVT